MTQQHAEMIRLVAQWASDKLAEMDRKGAEWTPEERKVYEAAGELLFHFDGEISA